MCFGACECVFALLCISILLGEPVYLLWYTSRISRWPWRGLSQVITAACWKSLNSSLKASGQESLRAVYTLYGKWLQIEAASVCESVCVRGIAQCVCTHVYLRDCGLWSVFSSILHHFHLFFLLCCFKNTLLVTRLLCSVQKFHYQ